MPLSKIQGIEGQVTPNLGRRNILINGAMQVAQRGTSATGQGASSNFLVDRFKANHNGNSAGRYTVSQVSDVHDGFTTALKYDCTTADTSIGAAERFFIEQPIEGQNLQQFRKGSSDAKDFVVSFYAKANGNFTYVVGFYDADNNRTVSRTFAVTSSWQRFTINFGADTSGAFDNDNALSLQLRWYLHAGSNYTGGTLQTSWDAVTNNETAGGMTSSFFSSTDNTFFLTGVQLEVGDKGDGTSAATPFEHRSFAEELSLCERYFQTIHGGVCQPASSSTLETTFPRRPMRAAPTASVSAALKVEDPSVTVYTQSSATILINNATARAEKLGINNMSGLNTHRPYFLQTTGGHIELEAEL